VQQCCIVVSSVLLLLGRTHLVLRIINLTCGQR
jgi:hypothetical protein